MPCLAASAVPSGVSTPWLMALLRNSTLAGSMKIEVSGSRPLLTRKSTPSPSHSLSRCTIGLMMKKPTIASEPPQMPAEKLLTSISKPGLILPSQSASSCFMIQAPSGPMIIAPRNIGMSVPVIDAHRRDGADDAAADVVDDLAAGVADQDRQQVGDDRADDAAWRSRPSRRSRRPSRSRSRRCPAG